MSELGLFWLLLPMAALSGWLARDRLIRNRHRNVTNQLTGAYFRGLNYLLNEEQDKALELFLKIADDNGETIEVQMALGNLFRRRGEVDRAIRIHQNLISRSHLHESQRIDALLELGEDYMSAGLLDRAEYLYGELIEGESPAPAALRQLLIIYQQEQDWHRSIAVAERLKHSFGDDLDAEIAQFHCEIAAQAWRGAKPELAETELAHAMAADPGCARVHMLRGEMCRASGDKSGALAFFARAVEVDPDTALMAVPRALDCIEGRDRLAKAIDFLSDVVNQYVGVGPFLKRAELVCERDGRVAAIAEITERLRTKPSLRGLDRLISLMLEQSDPGSRGNMAVFQQITRKILDGRPIYRCGHCGFSSQAHQWQCPSCKRWNTIKPIFDITGE